MKKILIIAYQYPPMKISSAVQRILKFTQYLEPEGWQSVVLTVNKRAAVALSDEQMSEIPDSTLIKRSFALDAQKHLSIKGRYLSWTAIPDRWSSWIATGIINGFVLCRKLRPDIIFSTYPIASTHVIAYFLSKLTGIPWVADFRDPMINDGDSINNIRKKVFQWIERKTILNCSRALFTTNGAMKMYKTRYPQAKDIIWQVVENGYDEINFQNALKKVSHPTRKSLVIKLLHSGLIYPNERDPRAFFKALSELKRKQLISRNSVNIILRATGHDQFIKKLLQDQSIDDIVQIKPALSYEEALTEMLESDGLLILQANNCNFQIPAKTYEYLRSGKPILALTDKTSDTANLLETNNIDTIAALNDEHEIERVFMEFICKITNGNAPLADQGKIKNYSREAQTKKLAAILDTIERTNKIVN